MSLLTTYGPALAGGALIGLAAGGYALINGRVAGISGMLGSLLPGGGDARRESSLFLLGLLAAPLIWRRATGEWPTPVIDGNMATLVVAGLLVGIGTRVGSGCTSGHGICGLARLSRRSLVAVFAFMFTGLVTVAAIRHLFGA